MVIKKFFIANSISVSAKKKIEDLGSNEEIIKN